jgi:DNA-binding MarR family transcriptional regulator
MLQDPPFDLQAFLPYLLNQAAEGSSLEFQRIYKERYGMLRTEWRVLFHLGIFQRMTAKEISDKSKTHKTKVSRAVHKMQQKGFLRRIPDKADRRKEWLELTKFGQAVYEDLLNLAQDYDQVLQDMFSKKDVATFKKMLEALARR